MISGSRRAFSLIELMAVLAITLILASVVATNWFVPWGRASQKADEERLVSFLLKVRRAAIDSGHPIVIKIDPTGESVSCVSEVPSDSPSELNLRSDLRLSSFHVVGANGTVDEIRINSDGSSKTFVVPLSNGADERWLMFAGRTGQCVPLKGEADAKQILRALATQGIDAY